jgi:hypothetical protein
LSLFLVCQLLSYSELTVNCFLHHPIELLAPGFDPLKICLQGPNLILGVLQVVLEVTLMLMKVYNIPAVYPKVRPLVT